MHPVDLAVQQYFLYARTSGVTEFMYLLTILFDFSFFNLIVLFCVGILVWQIRGRMYAYLFILSVSAAAIFSYALKTIFDVARPAGGVMSAFGSSFPSYHATVAMVFFLMLAYIFDKVLRPHWRVVFNSACVASALLVSWSRVYLGVHWLSDVLGGMALGIIISWLSVVIFKKIKL